jgi:hypothetical protein
MKMHGRRRFQPHGLSDLPYGGGIALLPDTPGNIFVDTLLHRRKISHRYLQFLVI